MSINSAVIGDAIQFYELDPLLLLYLPTGYERAVVQPF